MKSRYLMLLLMAIFLILPPGPARAADLTFDFTDVGSHWAQESIVQCRVNDFMTGYPGNIFGPERELSRAEALVSINRALGWGKEAGNTSTAGVKFPPDLQDIFKGHIVLAANKQLIGKDNIPQMKFNSPVPRYEVAVWIARALKLDGKGYSLSFTDIGGMSPENRDMLSGVVKAGIMNGYPDNTFMPSGSLTRAEMASILARLLDSGKISPAAGRYITGKLSQVDAAQKKVSVQTSGKTDTYSLSGQSALFRNGKKASLDLFKVGENVKISLDSSGKCLFIAATGDNPAPGNQNVGSGTFSGTISSITVSYLVFTQDNGTNSLKYISPSMKVTEAGKASFLSSVKAGMRTSITVSGDSITNIDLTGSPDSTYVPQGKTGYVVNKYIDYFTVRLIDSTVREISASGPSFFKGGMLGTYGSIKQGSYVELIEEGSQVKAVRELYGTRKLFGFVEKITSQFIWIEDDDDKLLSPDIAGGCDFRDSDGDRVDLEDIETGMYVELSLDDGNKVAEIRISGESRGLEGEVTYIRTSGTEKITIKKDNGREVTYSLDDDAAVREDGYNRSLSYVDEGMSVRLVLNSDNKVSRIVITGSSYSSGDTEGEVTYIRTSGTEKITIEDDDGDDNTYYIDEDVTVKEYGAARSLSYVKKGMYVDLTLDSSDMVTRIEIEDSAYSSEVEGEVKTSGTEKITIEDDDGDRETYYIDDDVIIREDGVSRILSYIDEGMYVVLTLDSNDRVTRIEIEDSLTSWDVRGEVTYIKTSGTKRITIEKDNGSKVSYDLDSDVDVRKGSSYKSLSYVDEGMYVELTLNNKDKVTDIYIRNSNSGSGSSDLVKGEVTYIKTSGTRKITVDKDGGSENTYYINDNAVIKQGVINKNIYYIEEGMEVELTLDGDDRVTRIDIIS